MTGVQLSTMAPSAALPVACLARVNKSLACVPQNQSAPDGATNTGRGLDPHALGSAKAMSFSTRTASPWPARAAYFSAAIFIAASGATNVTYGWSKGGSLVGSVVWAAVAGAVAIVFALAWPAMIRSLEARRWSAALMALAALLLSGAYSVTAALGSTAGARTNAAATETAAISAHRRAQAAYDTARAELSKLASTRPVDELEALLVGAQRDPRRYGCAAVNGSLAVSCPKLEGELARARQRGKLQAELDRASAALSGPPAKAANSDAKALARYLSAAGVEIGTDRLNDLLVLLAVLMVEAGGGLSLALGMALQAAPAVRASAASDTIRRPQAAAQDVLAVLPTIFPGQVRPAPDTPSDSSVGTVRAAPDTSATPVRPPRTMPAESTPDAIVAWLRRHSGRTIGVRQLAAALGRPRSTIADGLHRLAGQKRVILMPGRRGTVIELAASERAN